MTDNCWIETKMGSLTKEELREIKALKKKMSDGESVNKEELCRYKELKKKKKRGSIFSALSSSDKQLDVRDSEDGEQAAPIKTKKDKSPRMSFFGARPSVLGKIEEHTEEDRESIGGPPLPRQEKPPQLTKKRSSFFGPSKSEKQLVEINSIITELIEEVLAEETEDAALTEEENMLQMQETLLRSRLRAEKEQAQQRFEEERLRIEIEEAKQAEENARRAAVELVEAEKRAFIQAQERRKEAESKAAEEAAARKTMIDEQKRAAEAERQQQAEKKQSLSAQRVQEQRKKKVDKLVEHEDEGLSETQPKRGFWGRILRRNPVPVPESVDESPTDLPNASAVDQLPISPIKKRKPPAGSGGFGRSAATFGPRPRSFHEQREGGDGVDSEAVAVDEVLHAAQMAAKFGKRVAKVTQAAAQAARESEVGKTSKATKVSVGTCQSNAEAAMKGYNDTVKAVAATMKASESLEKLSKNGDRDLDLDDDLAGSFKTTSKIKSASPRAAKKTPR